MPSSLLSGRSLLPLIFIILFDLTLAMGCAEFAQWVRFGEHRQSYAHAMTIQALSVLVCSFLCGVYQPWRGRSLPERFGKVILAWLLSFMGLFAYLVATKTAEEFSRLWLGGWIATSLTASVLLRWIVYSLLSRFRKLGRNTRHVLVIGKGGNFKNICAEFSKDNPLGFRVADIIKYESAEKTANAVHQLLDKGRWYDECWLCLPLNEHEVIESVVYTLRHYTLNVRFMPSLRDVPLLNHKVTPIGGFYSLDISCSPMDESSRLVKRLEDIILGTLILFLMLPVMLMVAVAVKLSSPGPALFRQLRHGADGKPIEVYKFRSMKAHEEKNGQVTQATREDARVTRVGAFIRRTSLDELPQFINVLQGRMSIVGPRPHALAHNEYYKDLVSSYMKRHKVKPGITGLAQVRGHRGQTDTLDKMQRRVKYDLEYINNWSLVLDLKIILETMIKGFTSPNAY